MTANSTLPLPPCEFSCWTRAVRSSSTWVAYVVVCGEKFATVCGTPADDQVVGAPASAVLRNAAAATFPLHESVKTVA